jgi:transcriptional regulator with XRE-family HTH domain
LKFQRIEDLRIDNDITIKEISNILELHRDVYARYEKGIRQFPVDIIIKLAEYYNCTTDYLLGISNEKEFYKGYHKRHY